MIQQPKKKLRPILAGRYQKSIFRTALLYPDRADLPHSSYLEPTAFKSLPLSLDEQGFVSWKYAGTEFAYEPPSGAFRFSSPLAGNFSGNLQTGELGPTQFFLELVENDEVYGFGATNGQFEHSNSHFFLLNLDTHCYSIPGSSYSSFPFFILRRGGNFLGLLWNCSLPAKVKIKKPSHREEGGSISITPLTTGQTLSQDFFCFVGDLAAIVQNYTLISGRPFMPPLWSLGYHQSRWSYKTDREVLKVAERLRKEQIPCDAIHLDIHYMDRYRVFTWHPQRFSNPHQLHRQLQAMGFHTAAIVDPGVAVDNSYPLYKEGKERGFFCKTSQGHDFIGKVWPGAVVFPDFSRQDTQLWWAKWHKALFDVGVSGIWNDMNDPTLQLTQYDPLKVDMQHAGGKHAVLRNLYANLEAEATYSAFDQHPRKIRPWILTRSAFCGMQKYAAIWTGDNCTSWRDLKESLYMVLSLSLSGMPFCGADVGGFGGARFLPSWLRLFKWFKRRKLFSRWVELGSLMPFFRIHTILFSHSQEPWSFGKKSLENCRYHIQRRYRLLPYLYTLAHESHCSGSAMVRPLFYNYPEMDSKQGRDQFMVGRDLLAAPLFSPRLKQRTVFLPPGEWYEYESGRKYLGSNLYNFPVDEGYYPLFVRAGAVLPLSAARMNSRECYAEKLILEIYPAWQLNGRLYLDDGLSRNFEKGESTELLFSGGRDHLSHLQLNIEAIQSNYKPPLIDRLELRILGDYPIMRQGSKKIKGTLIDLSSEGRNLICYSFTAGLQAGSYQFLYAAPWANFS